MFGRFLTVILVVVFPAVARAQEVPEQLLSGRSQIYLRWDGLDAHREAFDKTAIGKMMKGDTGRLLSALVPFLREQLGALDEQVSPEIVALADELPKALQTVGKRGFRLGIEIKQLAPLHVEFMVIFPNSGGAGGPVFSFLKKTLRAANLQVHKAKLGVEYVKAHPIKIRWWTRGEDAVVFFSLEVGTLLAGGLTPDVTETELYKELKQFGEFPSWIDGYVDVAAIVKLATSPRLKPLLDDLGLDGLRSIRFHSGPDGPGEHCVIHFDMPGPRKGLLRILGREPISLAELPPLPADLNSFTAVNVDVVPLYEAAIKVAEHVLGALNPKQENAAKNMIKLAEILLGLSFRDDVLGALDRRVVRYNSPGDGPFSLGTVYLIKVKDAAKLQDALDKLSRGVGRLPLVKATIKKTTYHGATINEIRMGDESYSQLPSFAIHKGWLVYSTYPQPVRGYILRANGELPSWKMDADLARRLAEFPKDYVGIAVSDPRPAVKTLFSLGPTAVGMINNLTARLGPQARFDLSLLPNAHEATRHLFPNITVISDDGRRVRIETRASLPLPF
jgi:hypothetical protein